MKRLLTLSLALAAVLAVQGADTIFRVDMESKKDQIVLNVEKDDDLKATNFGWGKADERKYTQSIAFREKVLSTEWKDYDFSFIPSKSGKVNISIGAQWAKTPAERQWVLVNKMELNDQLYKNGDFKATWKDKDGRVIPSGFWLWKGAKYLPTAGEKGTPAILVNHDNRLTCTLNVEAGKKYELEFEVKAANPNDYK